MRIKHHLLPKLLALLTLPLLMGSLVFISLAVDTDDFAHRQNLSRTGRLDNLQSSPPKMTTNGNTIVVVWSDGFEEGNPDRVKDFGNIYLNSARESDNYWRAKFKVFASNSSDWGATPDVAFQPGVDLVHVVWAEGHDCSNTAPGEECQLEDIKYRLCDVSQDVTSCPAAAQVIASGGNVKRFNPKVAVDGNNRLHVVWSQSSGADNRVFYSRNGGSGWSGPVEVAQANGGQDAQLWASPNRLHLVWDDIAAKQIKHFYDNTPEDDALSPGGGVETFTAEATPYNTGNPGNPTLTGRGEWLFIAFDVENPNNSQEFALFYSMSADEGENWPLIYNIPDQGIGSIFNDLSSPDQDVALQPSLVVTSTGVLTRLHAVWHERVTTQSAGFPIKHYRIRFSDVALNQPLNPASPAWSAPLSVTHVLSPTGRDTTNPNLIVTDPAAGGTGTGHIAYLEETDVKNREDLDPQLDVFYEGGIAGTIDPAYILDEFSSGEGGTSNPLNIKGVDQSFIQLEPGQISNIREVMTYTIRFKNEGDLDFIGLGITDTLPVEVDYNDDLQTVITPGPPNNAVYNPATRQITWFGNVPAGTEVKISFSVTTNDLLNVPDTVENVVDMWSIGTGGAAIIDEEQPNCSGGAHTDCAYTILAISIVYLPVIAR
jgi:uncharacterized repeat protein (TIGR01451 family)